MEKLAISASEAAELIGVSRSEIYKLARSDGFPAFKVGERVVVSLKGLEAWVDAQAEKKGVNTHE